MTPRCTLFARCSLFLCYDGFPLFRTRLTFPCLRSLMSRKNHFDDLSETWKNNSFSFSPSFLFPHFLFFLSFIFFFFFSFSPLIFFSFSFCFSFRLLGGNYTRLHGCPIYLCNSCGTRANSVSFEEACPAESRPVRLITWI